MRLGLSEYYLKHKISLSRLSRMTGIPRVSLFRYAHAEQSITLRQLSRIVSALHCGLRDIVVEDERLDSAEWRKILKACRSSRSLRKDKSWVPNLMLAMQARRDATPI